MAYEKLKTFEGLQTNWQGLWWHPEYQGFSSATIDLSQLRKFKGKVRIYVRKNRFFNKGENGRPNYCFCIKDSKSDTFTEVEVEKDSRIKEWEHYEELYGITIYDHYRCPCCGGEPYHGGNITAYEYCPYCGQRLDGVHSLGFI